jgi:hypothetical protein
MGRITTALLNLIMTNYHGDEFISCWFYVYFNHDFS